MGPVPVEVGSVGQLLRRMDAGGFQHIVGNPQGDCVHQVLVPQIEGDGGSLVEAAEVLQVAFESLPAGGQHRSPPGSLHPTGAAKAEDADDRPVDDEGDDETGHQEGRPAGPGHRRPEGIHGQEDEDEDPHRPSQWSRPATVQQAETHLLVQGCLFEGVVTPGIGGCVVADLVAELGQGQGTLAQDPAEDLHDRALDGTGGPGGVSQADLQVGDLLAAQAGPGAPLHRHRLGDQGAPADQIEHRGNEVLGADPALPQQSPDQRRGMVGGRLLFVLAIVGDLRLPTVAAVDHRHRDRGRQEGQQAQHHHQEGEEGSIGRGLLVLGSLEGEDLIETVTPDHRGSGRRPQPGTGKHHPELDPLSGRDALGGEGGRDTVVSQ